MSTEHNAHLTSRWLLEGSRGAIDLAGRVFSESFRTNGKTVGRDGPKRNVMNRLTGFPDFEARIEDQLAIDDKVVTRLIWTGTQTGEYSGLAPTGRRVEVMALTLFRFSAGRAVENWTVIDQFGLFRQLGALPANLLAAQVPPSR